MLPEYLLERVYLPTRVLGSIYDPDMKFICKTLELPWNENRRAISCIPEGTYRVVKQSAKPSRPYRYFRLPHVKGRSGILIHRGIKPEHSKGCILVASRFANVESAEPILAESALKLTWMTDNLPDEFNLIIKEK